MATLQLGEEVAHALIRNLAANDNIPDGNSIRGYGWLGVISCRNGCTPCMSESGGEAGAICGRGELRAGHRHEELECAGPIYSPKRTFVPSRGYVAYSPIADNGEKRPQAA